jgi:ankyrin repeat protein
VQSQGTALYFASLNGHLEVVQLLLEKNADVNIANKSGQTPLHVAQTPEIANALLDADCDVYATNKVRCSADDACGRV